MRELIDLYIAFFKIGGLTFGGGLTMLPMLKHELVTQRGWVTEEEILDYYAVGQCTPGIIAVNVATFVGFKKRGVIGGIFSTLGMISPSLIIVSILALFLEQFMSNQTVAHAVGGIKIIVCALMLNTVITMAKKTVKNITGRCRGRAINLDAARNCRVPLFDKKDFPDGVGKVENITVDGLSVGHEIRDEAFIVLETNCRDFTVRNYKCTDNEEPVFARIGFAVTPSR